MATSIASQLQAIKSVLKGSDDPVRRPFSRPSVIFDPKEAADIDLRTILPIALSGLDALIEQDGRFRSYRDTLFSHASLELDREKMVPEEEKKLSLSICSYLRLLSGYLQLPAALKTLEYLIRRYQVHVFNMDELILCALPYHDTHAFVRIVQLLDLGNKKWAFLEGVKTSGAPPPRKVLVQQCLRDKGILEALCNYAAPVKEFQHARTVICFCTAVVVEALGSVPKLDTDTVQRILPFVFNGLNPAMGGGRDHKAGALMVVGLLATRATLASKLIQNLVFFIARMAEHDAKQSVDLPWLRIAVMAIVTLVQSQPAESFPKKTITSLKGIRDFTGILSGLSHEFNIQKFLRLYIETLMDYSSNDDSCLHTLIITLETVPLKDIVERILSKVFAYCTKLSGSTDDPKLHQAGKFVKQILVVIEKRYPSEFSGGVRKFLENSARNFVEEGFVLATFCQMFDEGLDKPLEIFDSKIWFSLEHPKPEVRKATLSSIAASGMLKDIVADSQKHVNIQDAIVRRLHDDDLSVVKAALSIDGLAGVIKPSCLLGAYRNVLFRCIDVLNGSTSRTSQAFDVAILTLERMAVDVPLHQLVYSKEVAIIIFPLLLVLPKTWRVNLKALELVKQVQWPFYHDSAIIHSSFEQIETLDYITSVNLKIIGGLADSLLSNPQEHILWLIQCSECSELAKSLFFFIILQAFVIHNEDSGNILRLYRACSAALKHNWDEMESHGRAILVEEFNMDKFDTPCITLVDQLLSTDVDALNIEILICIYWWILKKLADAANTNMSPDDSEWLQLHDELFLLFAGSRSKNIFKKHLQFLVKNCSRAPIQFLSKYFSEQGFPVVLQVEGLLSFATLCSVYASSEWSSMNGNSHLQLLLGFPSLLIPLSHENKDIRAAAVQCIEGLHKLWRHLDISQLKNGNDTILTHCISTPTFGDFLESIISQRKLITSDVNFLPSYLVSMLCSSYTSLLVPENINKRFDQPAKDAILLFILSSALNFSSYGKLAVLSLLKSLGSTLLAVEGVKSLLFDLLERRNRHQCVLDKSQKEMSTIETETVCLLLSVCVATSNSLDVDSSILVCLTKALKVDHFSLDDPAVAQPCITVLQNLTCALYDSLKTDIKDELFGNLVFLFRSDNGDIRNAARETLLRININCSTIVRLFELILAQDHKIGSSKRMKRKGEATPQTFGLSYKKEETLSILGSLLDILLLKKDIKKRESLVQPLFQVLGNLFSREWLAGLIDLDDEGSGSLSHLPELLTSAIYYAQQTTLLILKDITDFLLLERPFMDEVFNKLNINLLVECARSAEDLTTRNHVFLLLCSVAKVSSGWLSEHIIDIFIVIGEAAVRQIDSHSQHVLEDLISALVPCWLSKTKNIGELLQIFIRALPDIGEHRRLTLIVFLLRSLGEKDSLGTLIFHLIQSLIVRTNLSSDCERIMCEILLPSSAILREWEFMFAIQLSNQYSCQIWFPCLVKLLQEVKMHSEQGELLLELSVAMRFIQYKLQDTEFVFELESSQDVDHLQSTLGALMEQVILHLQLVDARRKECSLSNHAAGELKDFFKRVLKTITMSMLPSVYFKGTTRLLGHAEGNVKKMALGLLCETIKDHGVVERKSTKNRKMKHKTSVFGLHMDGSVTLSFSELCLKIVQLIDNTVDDSGTPVKLAAISSFEVLAKEFSSDNSIFPTCLNCVMKHIGSADLDISSCCLRTAGALISVLGTKSLAQLPKIMDHLLGRAHDISNCTIGKSKHGRTKAHNGVSSYKLPLLLSILATLESIITNLGGFLNPYLEDILDVLILHPEYVVESDIKICTKAAVVRKLLTEKIPVRLILSPLLKIYSSSLKCGEHSISLVFEMLASMIGSMDRSSIGSYHVKIFKHCLSALDLRRQSLGSVKNINLVEHSVLHAMIVLTMKLTETMFRPLFIYSLEWAESAIEEESARSKNLDRAISFYKLVNKLIEQHRSLFVPYFKYLVKGCTQYLTEIDDVVSTSSTQKRKKAKFGDASTSTKVRSVLSPKQWHLRALIVKSLHQCFLFDTTTLKFLDASNFQLLLKPLISQLAVEPPEELLPDMPTVGEVDESLVLCLGQMAVTTHSDVLWKPLNHEVLMQTRSEKIRPKILSLKVVKYLVEHLKEEYLVFLAETIPFLSELLEDVELPVKALAQDILKEMETLSGENLRQYL